MIISYRFRLPCKAIQYSCKNIQLQTTLKKMCVLRKTVFSALYRGSLVDFRLHPISCSEKRIPRRESQWDSLRSCQEQLLDKVYWARWFVYVCVLWPKKYTWLKAQQLKSQLVDECSINFPQSPCSSQNMVQSCRPHALPRMMVWPPWFRWCLRMLFHSGVGCLTSDSQTWFICSRFLSLGSSPQTPILFQVWIQIQRCLCSRWFLITTWDPVYRDDRFKPDLLSIG